MDQIDRDMLEAHAEHLKHAFAAQFAYVLVMKDDNELMALVSGEENVHALMSALVRAIVVHKHPENSDGKFLADSSMMFLEMMTEVLKEPDMNVVIEK